MRPIDADALEKMLGDWIRDHWTDAFTGYDAGAEFADMIERAETIDTKHDNKEAVEEAKNAVLSVIKSEPHWTPCSEELPKENGHYLVTFHQTATEEDLGFDMDDTDVRKMRYDTKHGWRTPRHIPSWINDVVVSTVLAWMPLPEPYKEGDVK